MNTKTFLYRYSDDLNYIDPYTETVQKMFKNLIDVTYTYRMWITPTPSVLSSHSTMIPVNQQCIICLCGNDYYRDLTIEQSVNNIQLCGVRQKLSGHEAFCFREFLHWPDRRPRSYIPHSTEGRIDLDACLAISYFFYTYTHAYVHLLPLTI